MKTLMIIAILVLFFGCVSTQVCPVCPPEDVIIVGPDGPLKIEKGQMIPDNYYTIPEWDALIEEYYNSFVQPKTNM